MAEVMKGVKKARRKFLIRGLDEMSMTSGGVSAAYHSQLLAVERAMPLAR